MSLARTLNIVSLGARMILGVLFLYASWGKVVHPSLFAQAIANYQILPQSMIHPAAMVLPWLEMISGVCLILGCLVRGSALIVATLLVIFISALTFNLVRGLDVNCGCFSLSGRGAANDVLDIFRDLVLLTMALWVLWRPGRLRRTMAISSMQQPR